MKVKVAVNGYGRIGRCIVRALYESKYFYDRIQLVAINELADLKAMYHLTKYDSTHGRFTEPVEHTEKGLIIRQDYVEILTEKSPENLPWKDLGIDVVLECTGTFSDRETAGMHIKQGAKKLIFSQPANEDMDATIVYGINHHLLEKDHTIISNASCTTNCVIPILHTLDHAVGIYKGNITTIHAAMHDQPVIDAYNPDLRKTRSAIRSIIPVNTELNRGIERIVPSLAGKFETLAIRVPTVNVSLMDLNVMVNRDTTADEINNILRKAAEGPLKGILGYTDEQLVSCDFNHDARSAIVDSIQTRVSGTRMVKILTWFDNEWGFANRMLDTTLAAMAAGKN
ncbi:MAG: type I glyceraldehyde-3-phosphate dehydrogenase [Desulfobacterales bacterium]|nr:type I glyceraldehyde-3-phosphate dehydrogenase [Desulfobacterales bacterium]